MGVAILTQKLGEN